MICMSKELKNQSNNTPAASSKARKTKSDSTTPKKSTASNSKQEQAKNKPQKLTLANINKLASKFNEKRTVYIGINNEEYEVTLDENFRETKVQQVYVDYIKCLHNMRTMEGIDEEALLNSDLLLDTLVLKHFTNLPIPNVDGDVSKLFIIAKNLADLGITKELLGGGKNSFDKENIELVREQAKKVMSNIGQMVSELSLGAELEKLKANRIDVDNYFSELELRNFEIAEDEDLSLLVKVIDQLNEDGKYDEYMDKLSTEEMELLNERLKILQEKSTEVSESDGEKI